LEFQLRKDGLVFRRYEAHTQGTLEEAFGNGTAAVISPIGELNY